LQLGLTACDYGSSCFAEACDFIFDPLLSGAACGAMPEANPYLVTLLDLFSYEVFCIPSAPAIEESLSSSAFLNSALIPLSFNFW